MYDEHEFEEHTLPAELAALERQLIQFAPAAPRVDRDRLMFDAGRASHLRERSWASARLWPTTTALATAASLILATLLVWQSAETKQVAEPQTVGLVDVQPAVAQRDEWRWPDRLPSGYLGIRQVALTQGLGALDREYPTTSGDASEPSRPITARQLLEELLPTPKHTSS